MTTAAVPRSLPAIWVCLPLDQLLRSQQIHEFQRSLLADDPAMVGPQLGNAFAVELLTIHQNPGIEFAHGDGAGHLAENELVADQFEEGAGLAGGHDEDQL